MLSSRARFVSSFIYLFNTGQQLIKLMFKVTTVHEDKDKQDSKRTGTRI